ncbi:hypothetical protein [Acetivibrio mesophilus]|mgnify:CR=1 FL=1|uniref:Uncharacterized protein n=1 Tax=Acetivibrio mesophilus TaxID=2487273 RepID=A0A4Q0I555_9FIRM|nr:hypothetical protein [Acetivibrio mesophilus]RXE59450.1 hypothetical protein EFD62_07310 [Acetivibrio mesophilus]HHV30241.1 DUF342 domain-containing protein [Clostridium sp.]
MFDFLKRRENKKKEFDWSVLKKSSIPILILDERWHTVFKNTEKSKDIIEKEEKLKELLKEESRLAFEKKEILSRKKSCLEKILKLTPEVFDNNNLQSKEEMQKYEKEINHINERINSIDAEIDNMPEKIREANLELLEHTINSVYFKMRENQLRLRELDELIEQTKKQLESYIDEKSGLSEYDNGIYMYFHDLLGGEELQKLDNEYFNNADGKMRDAKKLNTTEV